MPKLKTNKSARKRFTFTANGKVKRKKANLRHILTSKGKKRKRHLKQGNYVADSDMKGIKQLMPYG